MQFVDPAHDFQILSRHGPGLIILLSLRLFRELHTRLLQSGRGETKDPVNFVAHKIGWARPGNALFVPPTVSELDACLDAFERFIHESQQLPALIKAGLLQVQFATIHPFLDGNVRVGLLLVTFFLRDDGVLRNPLIYRSLYLMTYRANYYHLLQEVRENGAWKAWLEFFLDGVAETANQAFEPAVRIADLFAKDRERIATESDRASSALRIHGLLQLHPFASANDPVVRTGLTAPTVNAALADLERLGVVNEITGLRRGRVFSYRAYLYLLGEGTAPIRRCPNLEPAQCRQLLGSLRRLFVGGSAPPPPALVLREGRGQSESSSDVSPQADRLPQRVPPISFPCPLVAPGHSAEQRNRRDAFFALLLTLRVQRDPPMARDSC